MGRTVVHCSSPQHKSHCALKTQEDVKSHDGPRLRTPRWVRKLAIGGDSLGPGLRGKVRGMDVSKLARCAALGAAALTCLAKTLPAADRPDLVIGDFEGHD